MKKVFLGIVATVMFSFSSFANSEVKSKENEKEKTKTENVNKEKTKTEDEALRCKVTVSDGVSSVTMTCWFCNCTDLAADALVALESIYI